MNYRMRIGEESWGFVLDQNPYSKYNVSIIVHTDGVSGYVLDILSKVYGNAVS